jgi:serine/threonine protein kinase
VHHLGCRRIRESEIDFDAHMSGFVYRVHVNGEILIKKEIPGPETVDEFLYEINALHSLRDSRDVIRFYGVVVDEQDENVKGLLISYADQGALVDVLFDNRQDSELGTPWPIRERWARQIVQGLADIHECGFVQGDFTLSNIVIDDRNDAKIIDINRRGCPVGWEPPEATALIESGQRLSMYIGVKSDLFQLGMVLWALATQEDEPEIHGRPLQIDPELSVPGWFEEIVRTCLSSDPRQRLQAVFLLSLFPSQAESDTRTREAPTSISVDDGYSMQEYFVESYNDEGQPGIKAVKPPSDWSYVNLGHATKYPQGPYRRSRGRSRPSPLPSHLGQFDHFGKNERLPSWARGEDMPHSYSDVSGDNASDVGRFEDLTPTTAGDVIATPETLAAHLPTVVLENEDGLVDVAAADNSGVMTPESLAVEHHFYGTEPDAAKTPTPRPREVKEHSFIEGWVRSTSPGSPTSTPMPTSSSSAVDGELVQDIRSLVLEPVPDDLPRLDGKSELVTVLAVEPEAVSLVEESALVEQKDLAFVEQKDSAVPLEPTAIAQEELTTVREDPAVEQKESVIAQEEPEVAQAGSVVIREEPTVSQEQSAVAQDEPPTARDESTILQEDLAVLQQTTAVTQSEPTIVGEDHLVDQKNPIISQEGPAAAQEGSAIVLDEPAIVQEGSIAIQGEPAVQEEPAVKEEPAVNQEGPAISHEEPTVAQEKSVAIPAESAVVVQEEQTVEQKEATAIVPDDLAVDPKEPGVSQEESTVAQEALTGILEESIAVVQEESAVDQGGPVVDKAEPIAIASDDPAAVQKEAADNKEEPLAAHEQPATVQEEPSVAQEEKAGVNQEAPAITAQETEQKASEDSILREQETELEKKDEVQTKQEPSADQAQEAPLPLALDSGFTAPEGAPDHSNGPQSDESVSTAKAPQPEAGALVVEGEKGQPDAEAEKQPEEPAATSTPKQAVVVVEAEVPPPSAPAETAALEGIGAVHIVAGSADGELWEKELRDDDLLTPMTAAVEVSTTTPLTTTTATTEGPGIIPAL